MGRRTFNEAWRSITDWKGEFRRKEKLLAEMYDEVEPLEMVQEIFPAETLSTWHMRDDGVNTGRPCGIMKYCIGVSSDGVAKLKKALLYDDYQAVEQTQDNRFALLGLCTYFGMQGQKNARLSACHGLAIDLDAVREQELLALLNMLHEGIAPMPTYLINSGHGLHLYYIFEQPISLKDAETITLLNKIKNQLIQLLWNDKTSADERRQFQTIVQDMRIPGSWTKFGRNNKNRCSYILRAFRTGDKVDLTYLTREIRDYFSLPEDWASLSSKTRISLDDAREKYPNWYQRVVVEGHDSGYYIQSEGLYKWWLNIITQRVDDPVYTSREGNRWNCIVVLYVMAYKCGIPLSRAVLDANELIPFMNEKEHSPDNEFTLDDVLSAAEYYDKKYVRWSNKTIADRCSIHLPPSPFRRNGRSQAEHLKRARHMRALASYDNVGRPDYQAAVQQWRERNPDGTKAECIRDLELSKPTVYKWWNQ